MIKYLLHALLTIIILKAVLGEIKGSVCSVCSCSGKTINCRNQKLNKSFDEESWQNTTNFQFTEAYFDNNHIGHLIKFPSLPIVKLSYQNNRLVRIDDRAFKNLINLEELNLSQNELTSDNLLPAVFEGPYDAEFYEPLKLKLLDLSANELHTLHQDLFEHLPLLERLYLRENPFKILDKPTVITISSLPNLQILDLSFTKIKELPAGFLHTPRKLHELVLKGNFFKEIPSDVLGESHDLRILNLNENPIKVLSTERPFPEMPSLKQLHISFMPNLTRIEKGSLSGLINLDYLFCRMNEKLTYISPKAFMKKNSEEEWPNIVKEGDYYLFLPGVLVISEISNTLSQWLSFRKRKIAEYILCNCGTISVPEYLLVYFQENTVIVLENLIRGIKKRSLRSFYSKKRLILDLSDNNLRYLDREFLKPVWNKIKHINILGNPLVCDCENQWIVSELVPLMINVSSAIEGLECAEPSAMKGQRLATLYAKNYTMRCLDIYGNHPENDGPILISIFVIVVLTLIIILGVVIWMKNNNTCRQGGRVNYHRAFYRPTKLEDPDKY